MDRCSLHVIHMSVCVCVCDAEGLLSVCLSVYVVAFFALRTRQELIYVHENFYILENMNCVQCRSVEETTDSINNRKRGNKIADMVLSSDE